jgi:DNA-binding LytR/AlgR family response regulator
LTWQRVAQYHLARFPLEILICDSVAKDANELANMLAESGFDVRSAVFTCPQQAYNYIKSGAIVDVCFLGILMPAMNGIKFAEKLRESNFIGEIVFVSESNNFASQSYLVGAFNYMLKPLTLEAVNDVMNALQNLRINKDRSGLPIKIRKAAMVIPFRDISYIEASKHNVHIKLLNKTMLKVHSSFGEIARQVLLDNRFAQIHRSFIVNLNEIKDFVNNEVIMRCDKTIPISKGYLQVRGRIVKLALK